jgi:drug/metabolite transporter superfamily protein YnfA
MDYFTINHGDNIMVLMLFASRVIASIFVGYALWTAIMNKRKRLVATLMILQLVYFVLMFSANQPNQAALINIISNITIAFLCHTISNHRRTQ